MIKVIITYHSDSGELIKPPDHYPAVIDFQLNNACEVTDDKVKDMVESFLRSVHDEVLPNGIEIGWGFSDSITPLVDHKK